MIKANCVLLVDNLDSTKNLLVSLNYRVEMYDVENDLVVLFPPDYEKWDTVILLTKSVNLDLSLYVRERHSILKPGAHFYCQVDDLAQLLSMIDDVQMLELNGVVRNFSWGSKDFTLDISGGYRLVLWEEAKWTDEQLLSLYADLPNRLKESLSGLDDKQLGLTRAEGKWSIKQIALHLIDSHFSYPLRVKFAIAESGRTWVGNSYNQDVWAENLQYSSRNINPEINGFRSLVENVIDLTQHFEDSLDRFIIINQSKKTVRDMINLITLHSLEHIDQIWETRKVHHLTSLQTKQ